MDTFHLLDGAQHPSAACSHAAGGESYVLHSLSPLHIVNPALSQTDGNV